MSEGIEKIMLNIEKLDFKKQIPTSHNFDKSTNIEITLEEISGTIDFNLGDNVEVEMIILIMPSANIKNKIFNINFKLNKYAKLNIKIANMGNTNIDDNFIFELNGENSSIELYSASIANKKENKKTLINPIHNARKTNSNIVAYEVLKNESSGFIRCISDIKKGSGQSEAHQELRLLVLDEKSKADSDPILLIDENDIVASHANAIGMLDKEQIFYLSSRGLSEQLAHELILNGYFAPVFNSISDEKLRIELQSILKEKLVNEKL